MVDENVNAPIDPAAVAPADPQPTAPASEPAEASAPEVQSADGPALKAGPSTDDTHPGDSPLPDPNEDVKAPEPPPTSSAPIVEIPPVPPVEETKVEEQLVGPRGVGAPPDALDEKARAEAAEAAKPTDTGATDAIDSIGNVQLEQDADGNESPHHQNVGPRGVGAPKDTHR